MHIYFFVKIKKYIRCLFVNIPLPTIITHDGSLYRYNYYDHLSNKLLEPLQNIVSIYKTERAFLSIDIFGHIHTWGHPDYGGNSDHIKNELYDIISIKSIFSSFIVLRKDGRVFTIGYISNDLTKNLHNIVAIYSIEDGYTFTAINNNGEYFIFGKFDINSFESYPKIGILKDYKKILYVVTSVGSFAALLDDKTVITWGIPFYGGDITDIKDKLKNIKTVYSINNGFIAINEDNIMIVWGNLMKCPNGLTTMQLTSNIKNFYINGYKNIILLEDGTSIIYDYDSTVILQRGLF